ncbi:MAG: pitrilysin family protein, partial [Desulfobacula sp.]
MKKIFGLIVLVLSLISCSSYSAFKSEDLNKKLENDPEACTGILENGMRYSIRTDKNPEKRVEFRLGIKGGSLIEKEDEQGAAHFIEHMAFNGTEHFSQQELFQFFHKNGVQFGPGLNAFTSHTETVYRFSLPADDQEVIDKGFLLLRDWAMGIRFEKQEVENEKNIILEELRAKNLSNNKIISHLFPYIYGPLYLQRLPIGYQDDIGKITDETLKSAYSRWYQPGHMSVAIVGDVDMDTIESGIKSTFSQLKNAQDLPDLRNFEIPEFKTIQYLTVKDRDLMESSIRVYQHLKTDSRWEKESDFRQYLIEQLHIAVFKNRFMDKSNQDQSFHQINYFPEFLTDHRRVLCLEAKIKEDSFKQCYKDIFTEYERLLRFGVSESEILEAGNLILHDAETRCINQGSQKSETLANMDITQSLKQLIQLSPESYKKLCQKYLPTIKKEDLNNFFNQFDLSNRVVVSIENEEQLQYLPTREEIVKMNAEIRSGSVEPYVPSQIKSTDTSNASASGRIVKKTHHEKIDVTVLDLSNGARVILKPAKSQPNDIRFRAYSPGGLSLLDPEQKALRELADPVFQNSGIGDYTKQALYRILKHELSNKLGA